MLMKKTIYALGVFDGVHLGHQALLDTCRTLANAAGCRTGVVTFTTHPDALVFGKAPALINSITDRELLLREFYHVDTVIQLPFDNGMRTMPWQVFLDMLLEEYQAAGLVCGHDFRFGNRGEGNAQLLAQTCREKGIQCAVVPPQRLDGMLISSTHIRSLLETGEMETACRFLGHPHMLTGTVIPGRQLGRTIGIPTANLALPEGVAVLRYGVYACKATVDGKTYLAVTNVGTRPTVNGSHVTVEPWLLDFEGDLYGKTLTLQFFSFLRPEQKFASLGDLQAEIQKNGAQVRKFFEK